MVLHGVHSPYSDSQEEAPQALDISGLTEHRFQDRFALGVDLMTFLGPQFTAHAAFGIQLLWAAACGRWLWLPMFLAAGGDAGIGSRLY